MGRASSRKQANKTDGPVPIGEPSAGVSTGVVTPPSALGRGSWPWRWLAPLLVLVVAAGVYANTLPLGFTWDDNWLILDNKRIDDPTYIRYMLFERDKLWRPLKRISFMADWAIYGPEGRLNAACLATFDPEREAGSKACAAGFHLTNLIFQAGVCLALYWFALLLGMGRRGAVIVALLFAVHPVHVEAVANISHRKEPMALLFYLLAFIAYLRARGDRVKPGPIYWLLNKLGLVRSELVGRIELVTYSFACYLLGMLSKEVGAVMLPFTVVAYEVIIARVGRGMKIRRDSLVLMAVACGLVIGIFSVNGYVSTLLDRFNADQVEWVTGGDTRSYAVLFLTEVKGIWAHFQVLVWPNPLYLDRLFPLAKGVAEPGVFAGFLCIIGYLLTTIWTFRRAPLACFALAWYGFNFLPVSNFIPLTHWLFAERFVYVPSLGFALLVGVAIEALLDGRLPGIAADVQRAVAIAVLSVVLVVHTGLTVRQNTYWENSMTLWAQTLKYNEGSDRALHGYGLELANSGRAEEAEGYYRRSIAANPSYPEPRYALGLLLLQEGKNPEEAIEQSRIHAGLDSDNPEPFMVIGNVEFGRGNYGAAAEAYRQAVNRDHEHRSALFNLANALYADKKGEEGLKFIDEAMKLGVDGDLLILRGSILDGLSRFDEAASDLEQVLAMRPGSTEVLNMIGRIYARRRDYPAALRYIEESLSIDPDQADAKAILDWIHRAMERG